METGTLGLPGCVEDATDTDISEISSEEFVQSSGTEAPTSSGSLPELPAMDDFDDSVSEDVEPDTIESASDSGI